MEKKIGKLSIRVLLNTHRRNDCEIYPLIIRVVYHRRKSEYSLGWKIHTSNFSAECIALDMEAWHGHPCLPVTTA